MIVREKRGNAAPLECIERGDFIYTMVGDEPPPYAV